MDKKEKKSRKAKLSEHVNLGNGRFQDDEIRKLESLVEKRNELNGLTRTYRRSYKTFDSEDTYNVDEEDTFAWKNDNDRIFITRDIKKHWDDGQEDIQHESYNSARDILNNISKLLGFD